MEFNVHVVELLPGVGALEGVGVCDIYLFYDLFHRKVSFLLNCAEVVFGSGGELGLG